MCGIAGCVGLEREYSPANITDMLRSMRTRGPDSQKWEKLDGAILGSVRLRITDHMNEQSDMPLHSTQGDYAIIFNGEIYNHAELRNKLTFYNFRTNSDTEVILAAYIKWGESCLYYLKGMFSFCIYDQTRQKAFLAVDPTGQKPLYYLQYQDGLFFASDIEALIRLPGIKKDWDQTALLQAIGIMFIFGQDTHIKQIKKLESGCYATWSNQSRSLKMSRYYQVPVHPANALSDEELGHMQQAIRNAVEQSCDDCFNVEVPYAHLLSGGIDSSAVLACAKQQGLDLCTYSIGLVNPVTTNDVSFNEFEYSRYVAKSLGTQHTEIALTPDEYCQNLEAWSKTCSEPHGAPEAASLYCLFDRISDDGFKVAFSGNGPDEIFDGYGHGHVLRETPLENMASAYFQKFNGLKNIDLKLLVPHLEPEESFCHAMQPVINLYLAECNDPAQLACLMNFHGIYPVCEFKQIDQTSMAHSIEVRSPLAGLHIVELAFQTPAAYKYYKECEKWIFKESLRGLVPEKIISRKKAGFPISQTIYNTTAFKKLVEPVLEQGNGLDKLGILNLQYLKQLWRTGTDQQRTVFYRLYILNEIATRQSAFL